MQRSDIFRGVSIETTEVVLCDGDSSGGGGGGNKIE